MPRTVVTQKGSRVKKPPASSSVKHNIPTAVAPAGIFPAGIFNTEKYLRDFSNLNHLTRTPFTIGKKEVVA